MPKIVDKKEKRKQIIKAAIKVFARLGVTNTKMLQIAEAAGIGKGTIYEYFKSKEELFFAAFETYVEVTETKIARRLLRITDPIEKLNAYIMGWSDILDTDFLEFADIMLDFWAEGLRKKDNDDQFKLSFMYKEYRRLIMQILEEGIKQKMFKPMDTTITAAIIIGTLDGLMIQWIMDRNAFDFKNSIKQLSSIIIDGLII